MKLLITCILAAAVFAVPCIYDAASQEPSLFVVLFATL